MFIKEQFTVLFICEGIDVMYLGTENYITFNLKMWNIPSLNIQGSNGKMISNKATINI